MIALAMAALAATTIWSLRAFVTERARANSLQARIDFQGPDSVATTPDTPGAVPFAESDPEDSGEGEAPAAKMYSDSYEARLLQSESYREARRRYRQLELASGHIDLARVMGISQETADRLIALLVERELQYLGRANRNPRNEKELRIRQTEIAQAQQEQDAEIAALIGEAMLAKWKDYQSSLPIRHQVQQLGARSFAIAEPLREEQVEPLIAAIHSERKWIKQELANYTATLSWSGGKEGQSHASRNTMLAELTAAANERIHAAASSILSGNQLQLLDDMMRRERELQGARFQKWREADRVNAGID